MHHCSLKNKKRKKTLEMIGKLTKMSKRKKVKIQTQMMIMILRPLKVDLFRLFSTCRLSQELKSTYLNSNIYSVMIWKYMIPSTVMVCIHRSQLLTILKVALFSRETISKYQLMKKNASVYQPVQLTLRRYNLLQRYYEQKFNNLMRFMISSTRWIQSWPVIWWNHLTW